VEVLTQGIVSARRLFGRGAADLLLALSVLFSSTAADLATLYTVALILLLVSPIKYPITSSVTTRWKLGYKSLTNYLTAIFFIPLIIMLKDAPVVIYWLMPANIMVQLFVYPILLSRRFIQPVFARWEQLHLRIDRRMFPESVAGGSPGLDCFCHAGRHRRYRSAQEGSDQLTRLRV